MTFEVNMFWILNTSFLIGSHTAYIVQLTNKKMLYEKQYCPWGYTESNMSHQPPAPPHMTFSKKSLATQMYQKEIADSIILG